MRSVGIDLRHWEAQGLLMLRSARPSIYGYELHLAMLQRSIGAFGPAAVVLDPISGLVGSGTQSAASAMMVRLLDFMKSLGITAVLTTLIGTDPARDIDIGVASLVDSWILLRDSELHGQREHTIAVLKSRGMAHSNRSEPFRITEHGLAIGSTREHNA
jgi:circadian clock protein KaiC